MLDSGVEWQNVVQAFAEDENITGDGFLGEFEIIDLNPLFAKQIETLASDDYSEVFSSDFAYHILKVVKKTKESTIPLEDLREEIQQKIFADKFQYNKDRWMNRLKDRAYIEILL